jgi:hypothetical protein
MKGSVFMKKIISLALIVAMLIGQAVLFTVSAASDPITGEWFPLGDIDGDGRVLANDARMALRISGRLLDMPDKDSRVFIAADVDGDGTITSMDARAILRVSAGLASFDETANPYGKTMPVGDVLEFVKRAANTVKTQDLNALPDDRITFETKTTNTIIDASSKVSFGLVIGALLPKKEKDELKRELNQSMTETIGSVTEGALTGYYKNTLDGTNAIKNYPSSAGGLSWGIKSDLGIGALLGNATNNNGAAYEFNYDKNIMMAKILFRDESFSQSDFNGDITRKNIGKAFNVPDIIESEISNLLGDGFSGTDMDDMA